MRMAIFAIADADDSRTNLDNVFSVVMFTTIPVVDNE
jgi:hypothetical protein